MVFNLRLALQVLPLLQLSAMANCHSDKSKTSTTAQPTATAACAPGYYLPEIGNFNLQLPYGSSNKDPKTVDGDDLTGCNGYQNTTWFYYDTAGGYMVMNAPPSSADCAMTSGSVHCRTELREENPDSWSPKGTNTMTVKLAVPKADDGDYGTVIGQVFSADYSKPVAELYYNPAGTLTVGLETTTSGGHENFTVVGTVPEGTTFTYEWSYSDDVLSMSVNGGSHQTFETDQLGNPNSYFKVGDYNQGVDVYSQVNIYSITIVHS